MSAGNGVLIVGGGLAGLRCAQTLRKKGYEGTIRMVCQEPRPPYDRPPLSKGFLTDRSATIDVSLKPDHWYADNQVELILGRSAVRLLVDSNRVEIDDGSSLPFDDLLIASGSVARSLPSLSGFDNVHSLRNIGDAKRLGPKIGTGGHLAVVGSGFIGQEVAASARARGDRVTIIEAMSHPLGHILGDQVGTRIGRLHTEHGITLLTDATVEAARGRERAEELRMADGRVVPCDTVVVGIGAVPATDWLRGSGLELDGIITDVSARTAIPRVFAAGDVTRTYDHRTGRYSRSEHWDAAARQGRAAALAMIGEPAPVPGLPSFWSDQYGSRIQYVGHAELSDRVEIESPPDGGSLIARYRRRGSLVAALAIDEPRVIAAAARTIEQAGNSNDEQERQDNELQSQS